MPEERGVPGWWFSLNQLPADYSRPEIEALTPEARLAMDTLSETFVEKLGQLYADFLPQLKAAGFDQPHTAHLLDRMSEFWMSETF